MFEADVIFGISVGQGDDIVHAPAHEEESKNLIMYVLSRCWRQGPLDYVLSGVAQKQSAAFISDALRRSAKTSDPYSCLAATPVCTEEPLGGCKASTLRVMLRQKACFMLRQKEHR